MKDKINIKMFKPFGSTISEQPLPDNLVKDFLADLKMIRGLSPEERQRYSFAHKLVGSVDSEYMVTPEVLLKYKHSFFDVCITEYCQTLYPDFKVKRIVINSCWYIVQKINQFNSIHQHTNHAACEQKHPQISCVGYLQIPKMIPLECAKSHHDISGSIEFFEGSENYFSFSTWRRNPTEKTYLIFPSHLAHFVAPMNSDDPDAERISFSFNAVVEFAIANGKGN
jgi:hypothetical protein